MQIRFLQTTPSENADYPFTAGQVITVSVPSPFLLSLCDGIRAELVRDAGEEYAAIEPSERAVVKTAKRKRHRAA